MSTYPIVSLKRGKDKLLQRKHPWIFSGAVWQKPNDLQDGTVVHVATDQGKVVGTGHYSPGSIMIRLLSFEETLLDETFWLQRLQQAYNVRSNLNLTDSPDTNAFRLVHGEGDGLPGLIIDIYNGNAVVQVHSAGMELAANDIATALQQIKGLKLSSIYLSYADDREGQLLKGEASNAMVQEHGHNFWVDWATGQKTGFFLDQRDNRALLAKYATGKDVLNTFSYSGGFSVYALNAGAKLVHSVDSSAKAIGWAKKNVELNNIPGNKHKTVVSDVNQYLKDCPDFDIVILDPPAYAKHLSARHKAVQGYKRLNVAGMKRVKPGGLLFTFSCSQVVDRELFYNTVVASAIESNRNFRVLHHLSQPPDHPVNIFHPEGSYLKGLVLQVE